MKTEAIGMVHKTFEYDAFKFILGNREVKKQNIEKIKRSTQKIGQRIVPIIVNKNYEIVDGQTRFFAWQEMGLPIIYVFDKTAALEECNVLNDNQTNWGVLDYVRSYATLGEKSYIRLLTLIEKHPHYGIGEIDGVAKRMIVTHGGNTYPIKTGGYCLSQSEYDYAESMFETIRPVEDSIKKILGARRTIITMIAWLYGVEGISKTRLTNIINNKYHLFAPVSDVRYSLTEFSDFYNKGYKKPLYFNEIYQRERREVRCSI